jgi:hypothetical protein
LLVESAEPEDSYDPDDRSSNAVLRCCKMMVAWLRASFSLGDSNLFRASELPEFHIILLYQRSDISSMADLPNLMKTIIPPRLMLGPDNNTLQQLIDSKGFNKKSKFSGTIHCEALLMALIHSFSVGSPQKRIAPFSEQRTLELKNIFSVSIQVMICTSSL